MYRDILGPLATILAAAVAATITWVFQSRQYKIARNKLRLDVFDKKYKIYCDAKLLLSVVLNDCHDTEHVQKQGNRIGSLYVSIKESKFFFDTPAITFLEKCEKDCENFLMEMSRKDQLMDQDYAEFAKRAANLTKELREDYTQLPIVFERELRVEA